MYSLPLRDTTLSHEEKRNALIEVVEFGKRLLSVKAFSEEGLQKVVSWAGMELTSTEVGGQNHLAYNGKLPNSTAVGMPRDSVRPKYDKLCLSR